MAVAAAATSLASPTVPSPELPKAEIILVGAAARAPTLGSRVAAWFVGKTAVEVSSPTADDLHQPLTPPGDAGVRVRVSVEEDAVDLEFAVTPDNASPPRILSRRVPLENGLDEIGQERVARVIHSISLALWEGREPGDGELAAAPPQPDRAVATERAPGSRPGPAAFRHAANPSPSSRAPARPREAQRTWRVASGVGYGATMQGGEGIGHGPFMRALAATPFAAVSELTVEAQYRVPHRFEAGSAKVELETIAVRIGAGWMTASSSWSFVYAWLGGGPDVIAYRTKRVEQDANLKSSPEGRRLRASAALAPGVGLALSRDFTLRIEGRVDVPLYHAVYEIDSRPRASAWPAQPGLFIAVDTSRTPPAAVP